MLYMRMNTLVQSTGGGRQVPHQTDISFALLSLGINLLILPYRLFRYNN